MNDMIFYNSYDIFINPNNKDKLKNVPGGEAFSCYFEIFSRNISAIDRTNSISIPLKTTLLPHLQMPVMEKMDKSFAEICDDRAKYLLDKAKQSNRKIVVMYSGGVDSTLILVSFLKVAKEEELKNIIVLLSDQSIRENTNFYYDYVIKKFECASSYRFPYFLGNDNYLLISGENADQLFGSQVNDQFAESAGYESLFRPAHELKGQIIDWFKLRIKNKQYAEPIYDIFQKIVDNAPIELDNVYKFWWWVNFTTKWQSVYVRVLPYSQNKSTLKIEENYTTFYSPKEFQLWSMNNTDKFTKQTPTSSKYVPKEIIFDFNKDEGYLKKPKVGSLAHLVQRKEMIMYLDQNMNCGKEYPTEDMYNYGNDFERIMK